MQSSIILHNYMNSTRETLRIWKFVAIISSINVFISLITNVKTSLSDEDELVFGETYPQYENARRGLTPKQELYLIREIQSAVIEKVPFGPGIPAYSPREPADVLKRDTGLCYDRSRLFDKLYIWAGFETRHIYVLFKPKWGDQYWLPFWIAYSEIR